MRIYCYIVFIFLSISLVSPTTTTLPQINHLTRVGDEIDINLRQTESEGTCHLINPDDKEFDLDQDLEIVGVKIERANSFVACRVIIGPLLDESLHGTWTLYEKLEDGSERRQPVSIAWANPSNPDSNVRAVTTLAAQNTVTNYGATVHYAVRRNGDLESCHLIVPDGTDLILGSASLNPGIRWIGLNSNFACIIALGPINEEMIGQWTLYGRFRSGNNLRESRQPMTTFLYNEENPYEQAYNITTDNTVRHTVNMNANLAISITGSGTVDGCYLKVPDGQIVQLDANLEYTGVSVVSSGSSAACRITIGPITEELLGDWTLIGKFNNRGNFSERHHPITVIEDDPRNPQIDIDREITNLQAMTYEVRRGERIEPTIAVTNSRATDSCHLRFPNGLQYILMDGFSHPGINMISSTSRISCAVNFDPVTEDLAGEWTLISRESRSGNRFERRLPFNVLVGVGTNLPTITRETNIGSIIDIYVNQTGDTESCHLTGPDGRTFVLDRSLDVHGVTVQSGNKFVACRASIGPLEEKLIGSWMIASRQADGWERRQPMDIVWANPANPSADIYTVSTNLTTYNATNFGATLFPNVRRSGGDVLRCHVITPDGSDLIISNTTRYPGIRWMTTSSNFACVIALGPIDTDMIGDWTLYTRINNRGVMHEIRQSFNLFLYNEEDPFEQAYNVTMMNTTTNTVYLGSRFEIALSGSGTRDGCFLWTPDGQTLNLLAQFNYPDVTLVTGSNTACRVAVGPMTQAFFGNWTLIGKFSNRNIFTEIRHPFTVSLEALEHRSEETVEETPQESSFQEYTFLIIDPKNPVEEDNRDVSYLDPVKYDVRVGESVDFRILVFSSRTVDSCHLRFPNGLQFTLTDGFSYEGIHIAESTSTISCAVTFRPVLKEMNGEWMLITRESGSGNLFERRLPFSLHIEAPVHASPRDRLTIFSGNDFYIRLEDEIEGYDDCKLLPPHDIDAWRITKVGRFEKFCGFKINNVTSDDGGEWAITYGSTVTYRAALMLTVEEDLATDLNEPRSVTLPLGKQTNMYIGPENSRFCRVEEPSGAVEYDGFGRCEVNLDLVTKDHEGLWTLNVGLPGRLTAEQIQYDVKAQAPAPQDRVMTQVEKIEPEVFLTCSLLTAHEFRECKFQDPHSRILVPSVGVGEDRYSSHSSGVTVTESGLNHIECSIRISEPVVDDLGIWRCDVETNQNTFYGFLTVLCPWAMLEEEIAAAVVSEPILQATRSEVATVVNEDLTMSCSLQASIRYCWFRSEDGRIYSVTPGLGTEEFEYVGLGLDAGECGLRVHSSSRSHAGRWSCNVGLRDDPSSGDQVVEIDVTVADLPLRTSRTEINGRLMIESQVHNRNSLEYCRFMRSDGFAFSTDSAVARYTINGPLSDGVCGVTIADPIPEDVEPWTVAVKLLARHGEILAVVGSDEIGVTTEMPTEVTTVTEPVMEVRPDHVWWPATVLVCLSSITLAIAILTIILNTKTRKWTSNKVSWVRNSFRNSFMKKKLAENAVTTPTSA